MRFAWKLVSLAAGGLLAFLNAAQAGEAKWRVNLVLVGPDETTCGTQSVARFDVEIKGNVVRTFAPSGAPSELKLMDPLKPDGSGKVRALNARNRQVTLDIDAGDGPRTIRYSPPYSVCTWAWVPV